MTSPVQQSRHGFAHDKGSPVGNAEQSLGVWVANVQQLCVSKCGLKILGDLILLELNFDHL